MHTRLTGKTLSAILSLSGVSLLYAATGPYDEVATWAKRDCDDYRALVSQTNRATSGREVAAAMRENVRRQRQTIKILLQFARAHPDLRDVAQLGLDEEGQKYWRDHYPDRAALNPEINAIQRQLTNCLDTVGSGAQKEMVNAFRKYNQDRGVLAASMELHKMWADHDRILIAALR